MPEKKTTKFWTLKMPTIVATDERPSRRRTIVLRTVTAAISLAVPFLIRLAADKVTVGVDGDATRAIAILLLTPAILATIGGSFRLFAHYRPDVVGSRELDGCGKYLALAASVIVVAQGAAVVFPL
jgi:hypothetical protein